MVTIGELLNKDLTVALDESPTEEPRFKPFERPNSEVKLEALFEGIHDKFNPKTDPTPSLVELKSFEDDDDRALRCVGSDGYLVLCADTQQAWYAHDKKCLDANFVYRSDLEIIPISDLDDLEGKLRQYSDQIAVGYETRKSCYILDNPADESYEVYYDTEYPVRVYGKSIPDGMQVRKYANRFHRDMAILALDAKYRSSSEKAAKKLQQREFGADEAIIISDGCHAMNNCASSFIYIDDKSVFHSTEGFLPTMQEHGVLISEVRAAINAVQMCVAKKKHNITYYYDNTSILNVCGNRKTDSIEEVREWKSLLAAVHNDGYNIVFIELHPKNNKNKDEENKALMFFHTMCDKDCSSMANIFARTYVNNVKCDDTKAKERRTYKPQNKMYKSPRTKREYR